MVYTLSREGQLHCLDAAAGTVRWQTDVREAVGARAPGWGFAGSPLVEGRLVICNVGTTGAAFDAATGAVAWETGPEAAGYSSPVAFSAGGKRWVAIFAGREIVVLAAETGERFWARPWRTSWNVNAATPIIAGDTIFVSSDYGTGCARMKIGGGVLWKNRAMRNHFNNSILWEEHLYGFDMNVLKCLDFRTGEERWAHRGLGKGSLIVAGGTLVVMSDRGELVFARASPRAFAPTARAKVLDGLCWTIPVLAGGRIYCRNREGTLKCLDVRAP
jgi:outer membrane protein assembly factor BamB